MNDVKYEVDEGDARYVLCQAVEKHNASMLVVGSHGYGAIKRLFYFTCFIRNFKKILKENFYQGYSLN